MPADDILAETKIGISQRNTLGHKDGLELIRLTHLNCDFFSTCSHPSGSSHWITGVDMP